MALIRRRTSGLGLGSGAFGKLAASDGLEAGQDAQSRQVGEDLGDVAERLQVVAAGLRENVEAYDANEGEQARTFEGGGV